MLQPFTVHIDQSVLDDLHRRLSQTCWPVEWPDPGWKSGVPATYMKEMVQYWANEFNWRETEQRIDAYPNFLMVIDGYTVHFLHIKGKGKRNVPIIISHGWPGSFLEFMKVIPLLTEGDDLTFDLIIPSLIGFGFSEKPRRPGIDTKFMARCWAQLMQELGYEQYFVQGGDFGAYIATHHALQYPERVAGVHLNYIPFSYAPYLPPGVELTAEEKAAQQDQQTFFQDEGAYAMIQSAKPLTLSYAMHDSPIGLCAWILQLFHSFSDRSQLLDQLFDRDDLLANITLYWVTQTFHSSIRLYPETSSNPLQFGKDDFVRPPVGITRYPFPDDFPSRKIVERGFNVVYWKEMPEGGHFAALEKPQLFADDLKNFATVVLNKSWLTQ